MLSSEQDAFFKANIYENFGDLGMNIKRMVDEFQQVAKSNQNIQTIGMCRCSKCTCNLQVNIHAKPFSEEVVVR